MKMSDGFSKMSFSVMTVIGMILSYVFLIKATKYLNLSVAYPVWTGIGAIGSILAGMFLFKEHISPITWFFIVLLFIGIIGIKVTGEHA
ncbi:hypothetical protein FD11_GL001034 [Ligilactobacillus pobuzihii E100301 = KCTC 13174]|uniref:Uncharacterized protein n=2 Tax=Ligilactobacillus pobuzihii TaxID=449659 RepID=A0A0R2LIR1_9LACO|nr:hypothetical protein FD11_GL001034 [Ligilactobacillus pobuzihii E100301 = KCTC 13174]KRN99974.1 hypothetical protein IV66_GL001401 [Ligilactobacillus pobuzihii]